MPPTDESSEYQSHIDQPNSDRDISSEGIRSHDDSANTKQYESADHRRKPRPQAKAPMKVTLTYQFRTVIVTAVQSIRSYWRFPRAPMPRCTTFKLSKPIPMKRGAD